VTSLDAENWKTEIASSSEFFAKFDGRQPKEFAMIQAGLLDRFADHAPTVSVRKAVETTATV
jgi:hypothetical protein